MSSIATKVASIRVHQRWYGQFSHSYDRSRFYTVIDWAGNQTVLYSRDGSTVYRMATGTNELNPLFKYRSVPFWEPYSGREGKLFMGYDDPAKNTPYEQPGDITFGSRCYRPNGETLSEIETTDWPTERVPVHFSLAPDGRLVYVSDYAGDYHSLRLFIGDPSSMVPLTRPITRFHHGYASFWQYRPEELDVTIFTDGRKPSTINGHPLKLLDPSDFTFVETRDSLTFTAK